MSQYHKGGPVVCRGNTVTVRDGEPIEKALRKFKKKVLESGLLRELKERETYEKPTTRRKKAKSAAKNRWRKKVTSEQLPKKLF
jgi:small subunit ribosomal protein S21